MAKKKENKKEDGKELPGYPHYPESDDIYSQEKEEIEIDPEHPGELKKNEDLSDKELNELDFEDDMTGGDLDVPGTELDDEQEDIGSEDEENNIYSQGGDRD